MYLALQCVNVTMRTATDNPIGPPMSRLHVVFNGFNDWVTHFDGIFLAKLDFLRTVKSRHLNCDVQG